MGPYFVVDGATLHEVATLDEAELLVDLALDQGRRPRLLAGVLPGCECGSLWKRLRDGHRADRCPVPAALANLRTFVVQDLTVQST